MPTESTSAPNSPAVAIPAPLIFEMARGLAIVVPIFSALAVFAVGMISGNDLMAAGMRAAVTLAGTGLVGWVVVFTLGQILLWLIAAPKPVQVTPPVTSTQSWEA